MATKIHHKEFWRDSPASEREYWKAGRITIECCLHQLDGNPRPYFSVTATIHTTPIKPKTDRGFIAGGCLHGEVLKVMPELAPLVALHLCDDDGSPMHAEANGWYNLAGALGGMGERYHAGNAKRQHWKDEPINRDFDGYRESTPDECLASFARHCRINMAEAHAIAEQVKANENPRQHWKLVCELMRPRWKAEAEAGIELLKSL